MTLPKCKKCKGTTERIYSQVSTEVTGYLCKNGHYTPTAYGKELLRQPLPERTD